MKHSVKIVFFNRLEKILFSLIILFLPTQLGKHFWPDFSLVSGIRVDYLSPTLYVTDLLIGSLFILVLLNKLKNFKFNFSNRNSIFNFLKHNILFLIFVADIIIGIVESKQLLNGLYGLLKFFEFFFFGFYCSTIGIKQFKQSLKWFRFGLLFESLLAIMQFIHQGSLGGIFYFFGERTFTSQTPGIARSAINGELVLRPYGTLPHPNVLAGYLLIAMIFVLFSYPTHKQKKIFWFLVTLLLSTLGLFLTLSRIAILLWVIVLVFYFVKKRFNHYRLLLWLRANRFVLAIIAVVIVLLFLPTPLHYRFFELRLSDETITQRLELISASMSLIKDHFFFGVGLHNFLITLPSYLSFHTFYFLQPVHSFYLLLFAETGIVGFGILMFFLFQFLRKIFFSLQNTKQFKNLHQALLVSFLILLIIGFFDHYLLTLQQGQLLFATVLGFSLTHNK